MSHACVPRRIGYLLVALTVGTAQCFAAEPIKLPISRDVWISAFPGERDGNNGASPRLKFKGIQEFSLLDFDSTSLRGKQIERVELWLHLESPDAPLQRMTVSTVAAPWDEGQGNSYAKGTGASFLWSAPGRTWNGLNSDVTSVVTGESGSIWGFGDASPPDSRGWQRIPVDPQVIKAFADGHSHGLFVQDDVGSEYSRDGDKFNWKLFPNRFVASRDMNNSVAPYLLVWTGAAAELRKAPAVEQAPKPAPCVLPEASGGVVTQESAPLTDLMGLPLGTKLFAARNEAITFFVGRKSDEPVELDAPGLKTRLFGLHKNQSVPDVLASELGSGRVVAEIYIPHSAKNGPHSVTLRIGGQKIPLELTIWDFTLPDQLSFVPEMNAYGLPTAVDQEVEWYRLAHEHRLNLNVLRYGWNGNVADGCAPVRKGAAWDWQAWDARFGPLLDGQAFQNQPRSGVPVDAFYLPLNEHWPANIHRHFKGGYWIETAFDDAYWKEFSSAAAEFAKHAAAKGWTQTWLQFYLNNKVYFKAERGSWSACSAPWIFDEPVNTQDFWALRRYGQEFNSATRAIAPNAIFRCDISRPEWQRTLLDGITGLEVTSGSLRPYRERINRRQSRYGTMVSFYGTTAQPAEFSVQPVAWCLDAWCLGADGVLPWQTIAEKSNWDQPNDVSLFYPPRSAKDPVVSPSVRLKSYRQGQQLIEYLTIYASITGQSRTAVAEAVTDFLGLKAKLKKTSEEDAGTVQYDGEVANRILALRARLGQFLSAQHIPARKQWSAWKVTTFPTTDLPARLDERTDYLSKLPIILK